LGRPIDYAAAKILLADVFASAEECFRDKTIVEVPSEITEATERLFTSSTQAYREALIGCALARILDETIDIHLPYMNQADNAFNGRTLDETVVNPLLQERSIPCSKGPYLSALRRNVQLAADTAKGLRDKEAFYAMLRFINGLMAVDQATAKTYLLFLMLAFVTLRDSANITLRKISRLSLDQFGALADGMLSTPSGGLMPVLLAVAMFQTIKGCFGLNWEIEWQGINVADSASGAGGDITVRREGNIVLVVEVTERPIQRERVVSTFNTKISPNGLDDYLFFYSANPPSADARAAAQKYFAQGHDINFVSVRDWIVTTMTTIGPTCRAMFTTNVLHLLSAKGVPAAIKQTWNDQVAAIVT
jgi:SacI restriction endonuclease